MTAMSKGNRVSAAARQCLTGVAVFIIRLLGDHFTHNSSYFPDCSLEFGQKKKMRFSQIGRYAARLLSVKS